MPDVDTFLSSRRSDWAALEDLLRRCGGGGLRQLSAEELEQLGRLYRRLTADLAVAQRDFPSDPVARYLNDLTARAHAQVYRPEAAAWQQIKDFLLEEFPRLYRANLPFVLFSFALFAGPMLVSYLIASLNPAGGERLVAPELVAFLKRGELWTEIPSPLRPFASSLIMTNNIQVAFFAFAGGVLLGLGTVYVLLQNGLMLGAVVGLAQVYGLAAPLLAFVAPHGFIELSVVVIAGAAGLKLGWAPLRPRLLPRFAALTRAAREAVQLILGCIPLLVVAGVIEGFVSPSDLPFLAKGLFGLATGILLYAYLMLGGRSGSARPFSGVDTPL